MNAGIFLLGLIILILGILASGYTIYESKTYFFAYKYTEAKRPYAQFAIPLIAIGLIIMVIGAIVPTTRTITKKSYVENPVKKTKIVEEED